jgi:hypothetical protein
MLSVSQTCRLPGRSLFGFLIEAITASARHPRWSEQG